MLRKHLNGTKLITASAATTVPPCASLFKYANSSSFKAQFLGHCTLYVSTVIGAKKPIDWRQKANQVFFHLSLCTSRRGFHYKLRSRFSLQASIDMRSCSFLLAKGLWLLDCLILCVLCSKYHCIG